MNIQRQIANKFAAAEENSTHSISNGYQLQGQNPLVNEYAGRSVNAVAISNSMVASASIVEGTSLPSYLPADWKEKLQKAAEDGKKLQIETLLQQGADVNGHTSGDKTPLFKAATNEHFDCVQLLLNHNAEPNAKALAHETPLYWAAKKGYNLIVSELIFHGAEVNERSKGRNTPLSKAAYSNHVKTVRTLIRAGAEVNGCSAGFKAPIYCAASLEQFDSIFELLLSNAEYKNEDMLKKIVDKYKNDPRKVPLSLKAQALRRIEALICSHEWNYSQEITEPFKKILSDPHSIEFYK